MRVAAAASALEAASDSLAAGVSGEALDAYGGNLLLITHDRGLCDRVATTRMIRLRDGGSTRAEAGHTASARPIEPLSIPPAPSGLCSRGCGSLGQVSRGGEGGCHDFRHGWHMAEAPLSGRKRPHVQQ